MTPRFPNVSLVEVIRQALAAGLDAEGVVDAICRSGYEISMTESLPPKPRLEIVGETYAGRTAREFKEGSQGT